MSRTFDALTERLADPDLANNRAEMLRVSRERAGMESTIEAYSAWKSLEDERLGCVEMEQESGDDQEMKELLESWIYKYTSVFNDELNEKPARVQPFKLSTKANSDWYTSAANKAPPRW